MKKGEETKITQEMVEQMKKLREEGLSYRQISKRLGITVQIVQYHMTQQGYL